MVKNNQKLKTFLKEIEKFKIRLPLYVNERNNIIGRKNIPKNKLLLNESFMYFFDNSILSNKNQSDKTIIHFIW